MVVTLPIATIKRILDRESSLPEQASEFILGEALARIRIRDAVEMNSPTQTTKPLPKLPENIVSALEKARDDKTLMSRHAPRFRRGRSGSRCYGYAGMSLHRKAARARWARRPKAKKLP